MEKKTVRSSQKTQGRRIVNLTYSSTPGKRVFVAGSFNNWQIEKELKDKENSGIYRCQLRLLPGEYQYKFIVNGNWCLDAENPNFTANGFGTLNSLLHVSEK